MLQQKKNGVQNYRLKLILWCNHLFIRTSPVYEYIQAGEFDLKPCHDSVWLAQVQRSKLLVVVAE